MTERKLLFEIALCKNFTKCNNKSVDHPCSKIVNCQNSFSEKTQLPEPWNGDITRAKVLFLSSNPSIDPNEYYPNLKWNKRKIGNFFNNRFSAFSEDRRPMLKGGGFRKNRVPFWGWARNCTKELLGTEKIVDGLDYAITEIVHCKSKGEFGVKQAMKKCVPRYLNKILQVTNAKIIVGVGLRVQKVFEKKFRLENGRIHNIPINGSHKYIVFLDHPNSSGKFKKFSSLDAGLLKPIRSSIITK